PGAGRGGVPEELLRLRRAGREGLSGIQRGESYPAISARGGGGESGGTCAGAVFRGAGEVVRRCTRRRAVATLERIKEAPDRIGARGRGGRACGRALGARQGQVKPRSRRLDGLSRRAARGPGR